MQRCDLSTRDTTFDLCSQSTRTGRKFRFQKFYLCMTRTYRLVDNKVPRHMSMAPTADHQSVCYQLLFLSKPCQNFRSFFRRRFHRFQIFLVELFFYFYSFLASYVCIDHIADLHDMILVVL